MVKDATVFEKGPGSQPVLTENGMVPCGRRSLFVQSYHTGKL